jgi:hypothetical protein
MTKRIVFFLTLLTLSIAAGGQPIDSLKVLIKLIQRGENDSIRKEANNKFLSGFEKLLHEKDAFTTKFDSLKNVSVITSEDNKIRLYTWMMPYYDGSKYDYFGFLQVKTPTMDTLIQLMDSTASIKKPESEKLFPERWIGAIYYKIIEVKQKKNTFYTLLAWKAKDQKVTQKLIEVLYIEKDKVKFGYPLIKSGSVFKNRMIFTFNAQASMTLNFDKNFNGIVFDHMGTNKNNLSQINGPDGTYDGLQFKKGKWLLIRDIDVRTKWQPNENLPEPKE